MTGNVNIYICSEANENAKRKCPEKDKSAEDSGSETEMKSSTSASSVSTTKLVDALKKKRLKRMEAQDLGCLCEEPENESVTQNSLKKMSEDPDESSFGVNYSNDISSMDYLEGCSLENCPALSTNDPDHQYSSYDSPNWDSRRSSMRNYSFLPAERDIPVRDTSEKSFCCSCKLPKSAKAPCDCESKQKVNSIATNYPETGKLVYCNDPVKKVEEEIHDWGSKREDLEEFTVCTNQPIKSAGSNEEPVAEEKTSAVVISNESVKEEIEEVKKGESEEVKTGEIGEVKKDSTEVNNSTVQNGSRKRESFFQRSWKRAMTIVKRPRTSGPEANTSDQSKLSQEPQKSKSSELKIKESPKSQTKTNSSSTLSGSQTSSRKRRGKPKILAKISSKQKQNEGSLSDPKIPKPSIVRSPQDLKKPQNEIQLDYDWGKPEAPKIVPCTFVQSEEPQSAECCASCNKKEMNRERRPQESGKCRDVT